MSIQYSIANPVEPVSPVRGREGLVEKKGLEKRKEERRGKEERKGRRKGKGRKRGRKGRARAVVREGLLAERGSVLLLKYRVAVGNSIDDRV